MSCELGKTMSHWMGKCSGIWWCCQRHMHAHATCMDVQKQNKYDIEGRGMTNVRSALGP